MNPHFFTAPFFLVRGCRDRFAVFVMGDAMPISPIPYFFHFISASHGM